MHCTTQVHRLNRKQCMHRLHRVSSQQGMHPRLPAQRNRDEKVIVPLRTIRHPLALSGTFCFLVSGFFIRNIAPMSEPSRSAAAGPRAATAGIRCGSGFYRRLPIASCAFVCRKYFRHTKTPAENRRAGSHSEVVEPKKRKIQWQTENREDPKRSIPRFTGTISNSQVSKIPASGKCSKRPECTGNISHFILARLFG